MFILFSKIYVERVRQVKQYQEYILETFIYLSGVINIDERPALIQCLLMGFQHVLTMFGSTILGKKKMKKLK